MGNELTPGNFLSDLRQNARPFIVLCYVALALTLTEFIFLSTRLAEFFPKFMSEHAPQLYSLPGRQTFPAERGPWWGALLPQAWFTGGTFLLCVILPMLGCRAAGMRFSELGLSPRGFVSKAWIYVVLFCVMAPGVYWASTQERFLQTYPFLKPWHCSSWCWYVFLWYWALYGLQFFTVEFFFRGFMCFSLEKELGLSAIAVMTVPYCMIHYHKPLPEALGAIVAGVVLGWLALKTRSIWGGVFLHIAVAFSMDALALWRSGSFPKVFWPT